MGTGHLMATTLIRERKIKVMMMGANLLQDPTVLGVVGQVGEVVEEVVETILPTEGLVPQMVAEVGNHPNHQTKPLYIKVSCHTLGQFT